MDFDAGLFVRLSAGSESPDLMYHFCQVPFMLHLARLGYEEPPHAVCMTPNVPKSRSVGRMWLTSSDPDVKPALDPRYFTDPDGHDEQSSSRASSWRAAWPRPSRSRSGSRTRSRRGRT